MAKPTETDTRPLSEGKRQPKPGLIPALIWRRFANWLSVTNQFTLVIVCDKKLSHAVACHEIIKHIGVKHGISPHATFIGEGVANYGDAVANTRPQCCVVKTFPVNKKHNVEG